MSAYYNEIDPYAAEWLRILIKSGHIADGVVDERSISDVRPDELFEFTQCHFFAGIGIWSHALRSAGWEDERPVWTGSCPCQPFSGAGKRAGTSDERHLWPHWNHLIQECRPSTIFGEQVASKDGLGWLDLVQTDMEAKDYSFGAFDLCAASFGAPHIRQRLWFVADTGVTGSQGRVSGRSDQERQDQHGHAGRDGTVGGLDRGPSGKTNGHWRDADWLFCRDGKWRPVEPSTCPLVDGATSRVGRLRAYGNGIVPQVAQGLIESYMEDCTHGSV